MWEITIAGMTLSLFTLMHIVTRKDKYRSDKVLGIWIIVLSIPFLQGIIHNLNIQSPFINAIFSPAFTLLNGPLLFIYVTLLIKHNNNFNWKNILHAVPFFFFEILILIHPSPMDPDLHGRPPFHPKMEHAPDISRMPPFHNDMGHGPDIPMLIKHFGIINIIIFIIYLILTIRVIMKHQKKIPEYFSHKQQNVTLKWIFSLPAIFLALIIIAVFWQTNHQLSNLIPIKTIHLIAFFSYILLLSFFGIGQRPLYQKKKPEKSRKNISNIIEDSETKHIIEKLNDLMIDEKVYLDEELSLYDLAEKIDVSRHTLTHVLNNGLSKNFFQYINEYRIEEVKGKLSNSENNGKTILEIAFDSGFNSKSSFNTIFKQYCQITPTQFRKTLKN